MRPRGILTLVSATIPLLLGCGDDTTGPAGMEWSARAPLPVPRTNHALLAVGGKAYAIGGFSGSTLSRVDEYDPATNQWTRKADMATARREFAAGVINGKIYVASGMSWSNPNSVTYISTTEEYDPATNAWTTRAPGPAIQGPNSVYGNVHITGGAANGRLYVVAFTTGAPGATPTYEYNPATNSWTTKSPVPFSYARLTATELDGKLYVLGSGTSRDVAFAEYDPIDNVWIIRASLPGMGWSGLVGARGKVYAVGGARTSALGEPTTVVRNVVEYDPVANRWTHRGDLGIARHSAAGVEIGGTLYVAGGAATMNFFPESPLTTVEAGAIPPP